MAENKRKYQDQLKSLQERADAALKESQEAE
jgi:hypothetical protein